MSYIKPLLLFSVFSMLVLCGQARSFQSSEAGMFPTYLEPERFRVAPDAEKSEADELVRKIQAMADDLIVLLADPDPVNGTLADGLVVTTFVDINNLYRTSSFGRYVAGQLMNEMQRWAIRVIDMRKSLSVVVQEKRGEFGLSRNPEEIPSAHEARAMLTGTYLVGEKEIIVNASIVDNSRGELLSGTTVIFPRNALGNWMLQDSASAGKPAAGVTYMKKLEM
ncbi:MAG: FlgO family outer membrane protein [Thermodesulfobacteriota bacterium]